MLVIASRGPSFCVVEFQLASDHCQFATRSRPGSSGTWLRFNLSQLPHKPVDIEDVTDSFRAESSVVADTVDSPSSASTDTAPPGEPAQVNFERTGATLNQSAKHLTNTGNKFPSMSWFGNQ